MKVAMVTGPSSGIGRATAVELARRGFHVIAAGRSAARINSVVGEIAVLGGSAEPLLLDLADLTSTHSAARTFEQSARALDVLVNNAGVGVRRGRTVDGFELQFGVNHLGHFMLTHHLRRTFHGGTRIIQVSSDAHYRAGGIDFDRVTRSTKSLTGWEEYATSKLANVLFARELAFRQPDWNTYAVHPGVVATSIFPALVRPIIRLSAVSPAEGADTVVWCATEESLAGASGGYYASRTRREPSERARDGQLAAELWGRSESWCRVGPVH